MQADREPSLIWGLLGHRAGDNNQLLALCEELRLPFETRTLAHNRLRLFEGFLPRGFVSLTRKARQALQPPWPDLVITIGRRSLPVAREIKRRSGGRTRLVLIGHPRTDPSDFDLVITTPQYPVPKHRNVLVVPIALSSRRPTKATDEEREWLDAHRRPHLLFAIGGSTKYFDLDAEAMAEAAEQLGRRADDRNETLLVCGSPRTDKAVLAAVDARLQPPHQLVRGPFPRFGVLMEEADEIFVTGDSLSMLSEAILTRRPVGMVEPRLNRTGRLWLGNAPGKGLGRGRRRDMRRIWTDLRERGLVGTIDQPRSGDAPSAIGEAADAVRRLLGR